MWVSKLSLENIRGFVNIHEINFSKKLNILIGSNNSGKSTLLNSLLLFQRNVFKPSDITLEQKVGRIDVGFEEPDQKYFPNIGVFNGAYQKKLSLELNRIENISRKKLLRPSNNIRDGVELVDFPSVEPNNFIYPYLSKRKVIEYSEVINNATSNSVTGNFENLYSKIDRLSNPYFLPGFKEYEEACRNIIGFPITTIASPRGKQAALIVKNLSHIPLTSMGEGVANLLGLIVDLCMAENNIFLIEEPENDIHPKALKALLSLIEKKSANNQFFISTHSNIVTKYLGSIPSSKIFKVQMNFSENSLLPVSTVKEAENTPQEREKILEDLGYEFHDYDLWKAWLFLEESSAEYIIRNYLIPMFVPSLIKKLRTYSSRTISEIEVKFKDFNNLFVFLHLDPVYKNKAWVILDEGDAEKVIIDQMKDYYMKNGWNENNFLQFKEHDFEKYYPSLFAKKISEVLEIKDKKEKRLAKKQLFEEVVFWIDKNKDLAKEELAVTAKEVILLLKQIDKQTKI